VSFLTVFPPSIACITVVLDPPSGGFPGGGGRRRIPLSSFREFHFWFFFFRAFSSMAFFRAWEPVTFLHVFSGHPAIFFGGTLKPQFFFGTFRSSSISQGLLTRPFSDGQWPPRASPTFLISHAPFFVPQTYNSYTLLFCFSPVWLRQCQVLFSVFQSAPSFDARLCYPWTPPRHFPSLLTLRFYPDAGPNCAVQLPQEALCQVGGVFGSTEVIAVRT